MKSLKKFDIFVWVVTLLLVGGIFFMPHKIPVHWNMNWQIDRYGSRYEFLLVAFVPLLVYYGMLLTKKIDPYKEKVNSREKTYEFIRKGLIVFLTALIVFFYYLVFHPMLEPTFIIGMIFGSMYIGLGNYMPKIPQNYFLGIRTPWTIASETVWKQTHKMGGYIFVGGGLTIILSSLFSGYILFIVLMIVTIGATLICCVYSYNVFKKI